MHLKAIEIISRSLRGAVEGTAEGREGMALGQYVAGMGFSNVGLGIVHSMAHPLGALYDTPHGVANAIILPTVMEYNAEATGEKYREIARVMGVAGVDNMTQEEYRKAAIDAGVNAYINTAINGMGERAGNADLISCLLGVLKSSGMGGKYEIDPKINLSKMWKLAKYTSYAFDIPNEIARVKRYKEYAEYCLAQLEQMQKEG